MADYCPKCNSLLMAKKGKYGSFFGCTAYPECHYTTTARAYKKPVDNDFRDNVVYSGHFESNSK